MSPCTFSTRRARGISSSASSAERRTRGITTDFRSYFLSFDSGARLEIMTRPGLRASDPGALRTGYAHLAFSAGSRAQVDALPARLRQAGYPVLSGPRVTGDGYYESCVAGFEGHPIEITE